MQACGEPPPEIVEDMSSAIGAELPPGIMGGGGEGVGPGAGAGGHMDPANLGDLEVPQELLAALPENMRNCPMQ